MYAEHLLQITNPDGPAWWKESACKGKNFMKILKSKDGYYYLHFLQDVLAILSEVSLSFQREQAMTGDILVEVECAVQSLEKMLYR